MKPPTIHARRDPELRCLELTRPWAGLPAGTFLRIHSHGTPLHGEGIEYRCTIVTDQGIRPFVARAAGLEVTS